MNKAICFLFVVPDQITCNFASQIKTHDIFFIIDNNNYNLLSIRQQYPTIHFIQIPDQDCINQGFINANTWGIKKTPTAWDKVLYYFSQINQSYQSVWIVEEDVFIYNSDAFENIDQLYANTDLLVSSNTSQLDNNGWCYWSFGENKIDALLYNGMVCSCRLSKRLLTLIGEYAINHRELFYIEIMINTIAMKHNLTVCCPEQLKTIGPKPTQNRYRIINQKGQLEWMSKDLPSNIKLNYMYHPVKNIKLHQIWRSLQINQQ